MNRVPLIATKHMTYATRALVPGSPFEASPNDAKLLKLIKKARDPDANEQADAANVKAPPKAVAQSIQSLFGTPPASPAEPPVDMAALRDEYQTLVGKRAFHGWSADEINQRMTEFKAEQADPVEDTAAS